ncbi:MAG: VanW family protein [Anaerolineales bacterium]|nr:VanW family protein [Anaerolineales bacterium]
MSYVVVPPPRRSPVLAQVLSAFLIGLILFLFAVSLFVYTVRIVYAGRILPGVSVAGVNLSNYSLEQAAAVLDAQLIYPRQGTIVFRYGDEVWIARPQELGLVFDIGATLQQAYSLGRQGLFPSLQQQFDALWDGVHLPPLVIFDERVAYGYLQNLARQIDRPMVEAELALKGTEVYYRPGQTGRVLNVDATMAFLRAKMTTFADGEVPLVIEEQVPYVMDASREAEILRRALSAPLVLTLPDARPGDPGPWTIEPQFVAGMFSVARVQSEQSWKYQVSVSTVALERLLEQIAAQVNREPENARFYFDDYTRQLVLIKPSRPGWTLNIEATHQAIAQGLLSGEHTIPLVVVMEPPEVGDDATALSLGITELVHAETTYFRGSSPARLQNIRLAAREFHGLLVPPYATFSMASVLRDISLENGYAEALIIYNGRTITGVGGGVCQVSTTLFRTAFFAGYPIVERHAHAFRVLYYEQKPGSGIDPSLAGLDATVYFPLVDFKFTNDRPYWLLMETYFNAEKSSLTWKFYSTNDGRRVEWKNLGLRNVVPAPPPLYQETSELPPNVCRQVDYAADGADVTVTRVVYDANGQVKYRDNIYTHYQPWQAVYEYGSGTVNPAAVCGP